MLTIKDLIANYEITASGFPAVKGLEAHGINGTAIHVSSLSPSILADMGIREYWALQLPRGTVYSSAQEIVDANLPVRRYKIDVLDKMEILPYVNPQKTVIVSRHQGTIDILKKDYWQAPVLDQITPEQIVGKHVVGTLPPHLIAACDMYTAVTVKDFDYTKDGDLSGDELKERLVIAEKPIRVTELD